MGPLARDGFVPLGEVDCGVFPLGLSGSAVPSWRLPLGFGACQSLLLLPLGFGRHPRLDVEVPLVVGPTCPPRCPWCPAG